MNAFASSTKVVTALRTVSAPLVAFWLTTYCCIESVLSKDGFIKEYSRPSNPGLGKKDIIPLNVPMRVQNSQLKPKENELYA